MLNIAQQVTRLCGAAIMALGIAATANAADLKSSMLRVRQQFQPHRQRFWFSISAPSIILIASA